MTDRKIFIYTMAAFLLLTLVSYIANGQPQRLSLRTAIDLAITRNREIRVPAANHPAKENATANTGSPLAHFAVQTTDIQTVAVKPANSFAADVTDKKPIIAEKAKNLYYQVLVLQQLSGLKAELIRRNKASANIAGLQMRPDTSWLADINKKLESDLLKTQGATMAAKQQLLVFLGIDTQRNVELTELFVMDVNPAVPDEEMVFSMARANRADLKVLEIREQLADLHSRSSAKMLRTAVFNARAVRSASIKSRLDLQAMQQAKLNGVESLRADIADVVSELSQTAARLKNSDQHEKVANTNYSLLLHRYENSQGSKEELDNGAKELTLAQSSHLEAVYDYLSARFSLDRTIGVF